MLLAIFCAQCPVYGQAGPGRIHLVIACDANPAARVEIAVTADAANVQRVFSSNVPPDVLEIEKLEPEEMTPRGITDAIQNLRIARGDVIVFYFSGHGAYNDEMGHFLDLPKRGPLRRQILRETIRTKRPRLAVILTDCCYVFKPPPLDAAPRHTPVVPAARIAPLFDSLFFRCTGVVDMTSSKQGEVSMTRDDPHEGSLFTYPLVGFLEQNNQIRKDWNDLYQAVRNQVRLDFQKSNPKGVDIDRDGIADQETQTVVAAELGDRGAPNGPAFGASVTRVPGFAGVRLVQVIPGTPAEFAGFELNDVILGINGRPVNDDAGYHAAINQSPPVMALRFWNSRNGLIYTTNVKLNR